MDRRKRIGPDSLKNIRLICTDVDGTLVEEGQKTLNPEYYKEIRRLTDKGIRFVMISGRPYESLRELMASVLNRVILIHDNGAVVRYGDDILSLETIAWDYMWELLMDTKEMEGCCAYASSLDGFYASKEDRTFCQLLRENYYVRVVEVEKLPEDIPKEAKILSLGIYHPQNALKAAGEAFVKKWSVHPEVFAVAAGEMWMNFGQRSINKGTSLMKVLKEQGIGPEEVIAFGDNHNDEEMLRSIPCSVAVGNAREEIKELCRYLTDKNTNDGVLQVLRMIV